MVLDKVYVLALGFREVGLRDLLGPSWGSRQYADSDLEASPGPKPKVSHV